MPQPDIQVHYQLRLVLRLDGTKIVTHGCLAQPKSFKDPDKTLDFAAGSEKAILQKARDYCRRGTSRKGELPGGFIGVVLVKHTTDSDKPITIKLPRNQGRFQVTKRPKRTPGTTVWSYFVDADGEAYTIDPLTHHKLSLVV